MIENPFHPMDPHWLLFELKIHEKRQKELREIFLKNLIEDNRAKMNSLIFTTPNPRINNILNTDRFRKKKTALENWAIMNKIPIAWSKEEALKLIKGLPKGSQIAWIDKKEMRKRPDCDKCYGWEPEICGPNCTTSHIRYVEEPEK